LCKQSFCTDVVSKADIKSIADEYCEHIFELLVKFYNYKI